MKTIRLFAIFLATGLFACSSGSSENEITENKSSPEEVLNELAEHQTQGNCDEAKALTTGDAKKFLEKRNKRKCRKRKRVIDSCDCVINDDLASCNTFEIWDVGTRRVGYELQLTDEGWKVSQINEGLAIEEVVKKFIQEVSAGNCEGVIDICMGEALESIEASVGDLCDPFETEIKSISCSNDGETGSCFSEEDRGELGVTLYDYELVNIDGVWKISTFTWRME